MPQKIVINDLPVECLAGIIEYLKPVEILVVRLVCKKWLAAVDIICHRPITLKFDKNLASELELANLGVIDLVAFKRITEIKFEFCELPWNEGTIFEKNIIEVIKNCRKLKRVLFIENSLELLGNSRIFETMVDNCPNLRAFYSDRGLSQNSHLFVQKFHDKWIEFIVLLNTMKLPPLQFKNLITFKYNLDISVPRSISPSLRRGTIFQDQLAVLEWEIPSHQTYLTTINTLGVLCPNLRMLTLYSEDEEQIQSLPSILGAIASMFCKLNYLKLICRFDFSTSDDNDSAIQSLFTKLPHITHLSIDDSDYEFDKTCFPPFGGHLLEMMANVSTNLRILILDGIRDISASQLTFLKNLINLQKVHFSNARLICSTQYEARQVGQTILECRRLKKLVIFEIVHTGPEEFREDATKLFKIIIQNQYENDIHRLYEFEFLLLKSL